VTGGDLDGLRDDVAYLRGLALEGARAPVRGGGILVAAGVLYATASVVHWAMARSQGGLTPSRALLIWGGATALFLLVLALLKGQMRPPGPSAAGRGLRALWSSVGASIAAICVALLGAAVTTGDWFPMALLPSVVLALYGGAWAVTGALSGARWVQGVALVSFVAAAGLGWVAGNPNQLLAYAAALLAVAVAPGLYGLAEERRNAPADGL
jgi:hypothetical protein